MQEQPPVARIEPVPTTPPRDKGMLLVLTLGMLAGLGACFFVKSHVDQGIELAAKFSMELPVLPQFYVRFAVYAFAVPPLIWAAALAVTRLGRVQRSVGAMLALLLFGFALMWPAGAFLAFQKAYDPPRSTPVRSR